MFLAMQIDTVNSEDILGQAWGIVSKKKSMPLATLILVIILTVTRIQTHLMKISQQMKMMMERGGSLLLSQGLKRRSEHWYTPMDTSLQGNLTMVESM